MPIRRACKSARRLNLSFFRFHEIPCQQIGESPVALHSWIDALM